MIKPESLSAEWITERRRKFGKDPTIIEGMIQAQPGIQYVEQGHKK